MTNTVVRRASFASFLRLYPVLWDAYYVRATNKFSLRLGLSSSRLHLSISDLLCIISITSPNHTIRIRLKYASRNASENTKPLVVHCDQDKNEVLSGTFGLHLLPVISSSCVLSLSSSNHLPLFIVACNMYQTCNYIYSDLSWIHTSRLRLALSG